MRVFAFLTILFIKIKLLTDSSAFRRSKKVFSRINNPPTTEAEGHVKSELGTAKKRRWSWFTRRWSWFTKRATPKKNEVAPACIQQKNYEDVQGI